MREPWLVYTVEEDVSDHLNVKGYLRGRQQFSRRLVRRLNAQEKIYLNDQPARLKDLVRPGDRLVLFPLEESLPLEVDGAPQVSVLYEDQDLLVVNKPPGMVVHPTKAHQEGTLVQGLRALLQSRGISRGVHLVNRLDKDTSGLVLVTKDPLSHQRLSRSIGEGRVTRSYLAIVWGYWPSPRLELALPIRREPGHPMRREIHRNGQRAVTHVQLLERCPAASLLEVDLLTGRTHQIRVHLAAIGFPLVGDELYGTGEEKPIQRQALHAHKLIFPHPRTGKELSL
ncbi:MAG: RluA family pseudouridine synthase [Limnochordia bacterium]